MAFHTTLSRFLKSRHDDHGWVPLYIFPSLELVCLHRDHAYVNCRRDITRIVLKTASNHNYTKLTRVCIIRYNLTITRQHWPGQGYMIWYYLTLDRVNVKSYVFTNCRGITLVKLSLPIMQHICSGRLNKMTIINIVMLIIE